MPRFICPFGKDIDFVERSVLTDLAASRGPGSRHALVGGGGIGYVHDNLAETLCHAVVSDIDDRNC
jgi:hypothetical protein